MRLVAYLRTSTNGNGNGDSLDAQEETCREWAGATGHEVVATFRDAGVSGGLPADQRPGLMGALLEVEEGRADGLVVHRLDRLARELHVQEAALAKVWSADGQVWEAGPGREVLQDDPDDPMRTAMRQVAGVFAQLERGMIRARLRGGRRRKAERGGYLGGNRLHRRFGYELAELADGKREYKPVREEQKVIARMRELRAHLTLEAIARKLDDDGVPAPGGGTWSAPTVQRILKRESALIA